MGIYDFYHDIEFNVTSLYCLLISLKKDYIFDLHRGFDLIFDPDISDYIQNRDDHYTKCLLHHINNDNCHYNRYLVLPLSLYWKSDIPIHHQCIIIIDKSINVLYIMDPFIWQYEDEKYSNLMKHYIADNIEEYEIEILRPGIQNYQVDIHEFDKNKFTDNLCVLHCLLFVIHIMEDKDPFCFSGECLNIDRYDLIDLLISLYQKYFNFALDTTIYDDYLIKYNVF